MMTSTDIQMCVADTMQDDDLENIDAVLRMLNNASESSWRAARGEQFSVEEVVAAIRELLTAGMVSPCAESPPSGNCMPVRIEQVGTDFAIEALWFHLEQPGRDAVREWWDSVGQLKFPLDPAE